MVLISYLCQSEFVSWCGAICDINDELIWMLICRCLRQLGPRAAHGVRGSYGHRDAKGERPRAPAAENQPFRSNKVAPEPNAAIGISPDDQKEVVSGSTTLKEDSRACDLLIDTEGQTPGVIAASSPEASTRQQRSDLLPNQASSAQLACPLLPPPSPTLPSLNSDLPASPLPPEITIPKAIHDRDEVSSKVRSGRC